MRYVNALLALCVGWSLLGAAPPWVPSEGIGAVHMPVSCARSQTEFDRGLALLHSFWYERSRAVFDSIIASNPQCRIAYWGAAMTLNHPLWAPPSTDDRNAALTYIRKGASASAFSPSEEALFRAVATLFGNGDPNAKAQRDTAYMNEMARVYANFPDDETALFYALSIEGAPGYRMDPKQIELAGSLLASVRANEPQHPGALHYTIHAFDEASYEDRGLDAARKYAASAPSIPHALHMPSHTFLALGLWNESNSTNRRAFESSEASVKAAGEPDYKRDFHTLRFLIYGDLQTGELQEAKRYAHVAFDEYQKIVPQYAAMPREKADDIFNITELAASLTTYGFETGDYTMASHVLPVGLDGPWRASQMESAVLAALTVRDLPRAKTARDALALYADSFSGRPAAKRYLEIARAESFAQYALASGDRAAALAFLKTAAETEDGLQTTGIQQPIFVPPAHEMLAAELLAERKYADAAREFEMALRLTPHRPKAVAGLAQARRFLAGR